MSVLAHEQIMAMIPHAGAMCLLDEVLEWDTSTLHGLSHRFCNADNPMRRPNGVLGMACAVELAAQAMAVHAGLVAGPDHPPTPGYLLALREVRLARATLDATLAPLGVIATRQMASGQGASYSFVVSSHGAEIVTGRATVLFGVAP